MKDWITQQALSIALPLIIGPIAYFLTQQLKGFITILDNSSATVKQAVALTLSFILAGVAKFAGEALPNACILGDAATDCLKALTDPNAVKVLLSFVIAHVMHAGKKQAEASGNG